MEQRLNTTFVDVGKRLINEHLDGKHTLIQLKHELSKKGIVLKGLQKGRGKIIAIISDGKLRKKIIF